MEKRQEGADSSLALYFSASRLTCLLRETALGVGDGDAVRFAGRLGGRNVDIKGDPDLGDTTRSGNLVSSSDTNFNLTIREMQREFHEGWRSIWVVNPRVTFRHRMCVDGKSKSNNQLP